MIYKVIFIYFQNIVSFFLYIVNNLVLCEWFEKLILKDLNYIDNVSCQDFIIVILFNLDMYKKVLFILWK